MRTLPDFLCIGAQKAGTSWLYVLLQEHPEIWMPPIKELHYFDHLFVPENRKWTKWHIRLHASREIEKQLKSPDGVNFDQIRYLAEFASKDPFTEEWYRRAFDRPAARFKSLGDITPEYSTIPQEGLKYVRSLLGAVKIIYIIRDPISRALSQLRMNASRKKQIMSSENDWLELARSPEVFNRGDYAQYVPLWRDMFADDILFIPYGKIASAPEAVLGSIEQFIGIGSHEYANVGKRVHETKKADIPEVVKDYLCEEMSSQITFLEREFGPEFSNAT